MLRVPSLSAPRRRVGLLAATAAVVSLPALAALAAPRAPAKPAPLRYNRDIRPILSDNCFQCHGPDRASRMAGLRLDIREEAMKKGVLAPGTPTESRLVARITGKGGPVMPPASSHKTLTAAQKQLLTRWIAEGAEYEPHWAFVPLPAKVVVPAVRSAAWCRSEIDRFVLARLEKGGIKPSPEATRADWLRRVTLDLTGLPPTLKEGDAFAADRSPQAYEKVVDRLLASKRYGERMAVPWLDVARYADSYGYQSDQLCPTWPYRDWVVKAFNDNLPYDQFITWQLAGDLLPNATREQRLATAFNRLHRMTNEGGSVAEEWRLEGVADRVNTLGTAFLGLTLECARCHDHKYDPVSQRDYYSLSAFFNSIDEYGMYDRADIVPTPSLLLPTPEQEQRLSAARHAAQDAEQRLRQLRPEREAAFQHWLSEAGKVVEVDLTGRFDFEQFEGNQIPNRVEGAKAGGQREDNPLLVEGKKGKAVELNGDNNVSFPALGRFTRHTPYTLAFWMRDAGLAAEPAVIFQGCSGTDAGPHGYDLLLQEGRLTARMFRHWPGNAIAVRTTETVEKNAWTHVAVTYDGSSRASGLKIYLNGRPAGLDVLRDHLYKGTGVHNLVFGQRFRDKGFKGGRIDELSVYERSLTPIEVAQLHDGKSLKEALAQPLLNQGDLRAYFFSAIDGEMRQAARALADARQQVWQAEDPEFEIAVMEEMPQPRPTHVLARGAYDAPKNDKNRVERGVPSAIFAFPKDAPRDRLGLARWLTAPNHPLTARVAVNRIWSLLFGRGLVETSENFGMQGVLPSHPELLDWLARDFVSSRWNVKRLVKKIVLSATYRQSSALRPDLQQRDPQNLLLARGPSYRLGAEAIRDLALASAGLLDDRVGGPPVSPYQPGDLWREANSMSPAYRQSVGQDLYRRSLYSVWKRTAPLPNMLAFDAVSREVCVARRSRTSTPLQALVLLNDPQFVEAARLVGERTLREGGATSPERARFAFRLLASREPRPPELELLTRFYEGQRALFNKSPEQGAALLKVGERKPDPKLPASELAAATVLAQAVLNLDATIWKR